jgi:hypothetical protein
MERYYPMGKSHFSGPVFSAGGFAGAEDSNGAIVANMTTMRAPATAIATAGNVTYTTAQLMTGFISRDVNGGNRTDVLPTAALLVAGLAGSAPTSQNYPTVGTSIHFTLHNNASGAFTLALSLGTGGTTAMGNNTFWVFGTTTIAQNAAPRAFTLVLTNVTPGAEAYIAYAA